MEMNEASLKPSKIELPCACANLRRAARAVTQLYDDQLRSSGVRTTQFTLLRVLSRMSPLTQGSLGSVLCMDSTTLTRTLRPLIRSRWIAASPGTDRRERVLRLTPRGRKLLTEADPQWKRAQERLRKNLGVGNWKRMQSMLTAAAEAAAQA